MPNVSADRRTIDDQNAVLVDLVFFQRFSNRIFRVRVLSAVKMRLILL